MSTTRTEVKTQDGPDRMTTSQGGARRSTAWLVRVGFYAALGLVAWLMATDMSSVAVGGLAGVLMILLLLMKAPIAVAMGLSGAYALFSIRSWDVVAGTFRSVPFATVSVWTYTVLPMFIFMGLLLWRSGITDRLYAAANVWLSWLPGGLAVGTNFAGAGLSSVSGSTVATVSAIGRIGLPEMLKAKYDPRLAAGSVLIAGTGGQLIPPSIYMVIYAGVVAVPVGPQLIAGVLPGVALHVLYAVMIVALVLAFPGLVGKTRGKTLSDAPKIEWSQRWRALGSIWAIPVLVLVMFGGMYRGFFTATEAGAFGALGAVVLSAVYLDRKSFYEALKRSLGDTAASTAGIFFLFMGAMIFNRALTVSGAATWTANTIEGLGLSPFQFLLALMAMYLILGMLLDPLTMMLVTVPVLLPTLIDMGIDLMFFGVFVVMLGELAFITPPVGMMVFILHKIVQDRDVNRGTIVSLRHVFEGALWFIPISVVLLVLMIIYPEIATWLPRGMGSD